LEAERDIVYDQMSLAPVVRIAERNDDPNSRHREFSLAVVFYAEEHSRDTGMLTNPLPSLGKLFSDFFADG